MMKVVNADLYEFLNTHETGIGVSDRDGNIEAWVHIPFEDFRDFINAVGSSWFDCGGVDCRLQEDNVCIDITNFIDGEGHLLSSYKNCFNQENYKDCEEQILKLEE